MQPFVVNRHDRIVFPSNFIPELDVSVMHSLEQLESVIRRDFEVKAPSGTEILRRVEQGAYSSRYELMRDVAIRRGVVKVVEDFRRAARIDEPGFERVFASGGGPPAVVGRDVKGHLIVPAITLFALVPGIRAQVPDGRDRLIEYLLENFDEIVYV